MTSLISNRAIDADDFEDGANDPYLIHERESQEKFAREGQSALALQIAANLYHSKEEVLAAAEDFRNFLRA